MIKKKKNKINIFKLKIINFNKKNIYIYYISEL